MTDNKQVIYEWQLKGAEIYISHWEPELLTQKTQLEKYRSLQEHLTVDSESPNLLKSSSAVQELEDLTFQIRILERSVKELERHLDENRTAKQNFLILLDRV
jgi:hypothetical protein